MRTIITIIFVVIYCIVSLPVFLIMLLIGLFSKKKRALVSQHIVSWGFRIVTALSGARVHASGLENVPEDGSVIYVCNHRGIFDVIIGYSMAKYPAMFIAKKETKKLPVISIWMKFINCLFMDREDIRASLKVIMTAADLAKDGTSIFIFPEGTRTKDGSLGEFKEGSFKIAQRSGRPVVPVAIYNTESIFEKQLPWLRKCDVCFSFGKPFYLADLTGDDKKHPGLYTKGIIQEMLDKEMLETAAEK